MTDAQQLQSVVAAGLTLANRHKAIAGLFDRETHDG
jgi:hypothetical protein